MFRVTSSAEPGSTLWSKIQDLALRQTFAPERVNKVNLRREFFNTTPDAVLEVLKAREVELLQFTLEPATEEFHISWPECVGA